LHRLFLRIGDVGVATASAAGLPARLKPPGRQKVLKTHAEGRARFYECQAEMPPDKLIWRVFPRADRRNAIGRRQGPVGPSYAGPNWGASRRQRPVFRQDRRQRAPGPPKARRTPVAEAGGRNAKNAASPASSARVPNHGTADQHSRARQTRRPLARNHARAAVLKARPLTPPTTSFFFRKS